jgi:hypothetical protein
MDHVTRQGAPVGPFARLLRWTVPWIVLAGIVAVVASFSGQFRRAAESRGTGSSVTTATVDSTGSVGVTGTIAPSSPATKAPSTTSTKSATGAGVTPVSAGRSATVTAQAAGGGTVGVTLIPGIRLRTWAVDGSAVVAELAEGAVLEILGQKAEWYQVKDPAGFTGWVKSAPDLIRIEDR